MTRGLRARTVAFVLIAPVAAMSVVGCGGRTEAFGPSPSEDAAPSDARPAIDSGPASDSGPPEVDASADCPAPGNVNAGAPFGIRCPPPPTCPPLAMVHAGGSCSVSPTMMCPSATPVYGCTGAVLGYLPCQCPQGQWACQQATPLACVDASPPPSTCPDAGTLMEGALCSDNGLSCRGNPTPCGGTVFYDALQCDGSKFVTVAMTVCGIDGGADASTD